MPETVALGTAARLSGPDPWTPFRNIALNEGDCLILSAVSDGAVNNVAWRGNKMQIGAISAGLSDACIMYLFVTAAMAGTGDVVVTKNGLGANLALRKVTGLAALTATSWQNGDNYGDAPSDPPVQEPYSRGFLIGVMGGTYQVKYFTRGQWQQGWTAGQFVGTERFVLDEGYKITSAPEMSQAQITGQTAVNYWMCHLVFRCCS